MIHLLLHFLLVVVSSHDPIELRVVGNISVCPAPCDINVIVRIEPHEDNRAYELVISGEGDYFSDSLIDLDGRFSPATQSIRRFQYISAGTYQIQAILLRTASGVEVARASRNLVVTGRD